MNPAEAVTTALSTLVSVLGLWVLYAWFYRDYRRDVFRQHLFALRDELFDMAARGEIRFDHPAYRLLRAAINGFIRFGDRLTFATIMLIAWSTRKDNLPQALGDEAFGPQFDKARETLAPEIQAKLDATLKRVHICVLNNILLTSPVFLVLMPILSIVIAVVILVSGLKDGIRVLRADVYGKLRGSFSTLDSAALHLGAAV